jgi:thymidylate synthase ThyX
VSQSIDWVRTHDSQKFLESFYFQYGHASIADLGHVVLCLEGISELAATEAEDEQLWDGQARSSRYQDFSKAGVIVPPELGPEEASAYTAAGDRLIAGYKQIHAQMCEYLGERIPRPDAMKPDAYQRNIAARAFDVARYLLFFGIPTGVGQVTSIRTLERQIRRLKASQYGELRELGDEMAAACAAAPDCVWDASSGAEPLAPTLARHVEPDVFPAGSRRDLKLWAEQNLPPPRDIAVDDVDLCRSIDTLSDIAATLLYPVTTRPYRELLEILCGWSLERRYEVIDVALQSRSRRDELLREFRGAPYAYDMVIDIGAYRDLHRHRRCQQFRQEYSTALGFETPPQLADAGLAGHYGNLIESAFASASELPAPADQYLLPFATRARFLFKLDFAEAEYICRLRSGVKGHFSYRRIAWQMKEKMEQLEPELGRLMQATPPWIEDPLHR